MRDLYKNMPGSPGVYLMKDTAGRVLYIGKAANLKRRVSSYFARANDARIERLMSKVKKIDHQKTDSALEALILEAKLIKKLKPPFNIKEKDDKSFLYIEITKEYFPRVLLVRGRETRSAAKRYGPFVSAANAREALRILRRIFPWSIHTESSVKCRVSGVAKPCLDYEIGLCPGTCIGAISKKDYLKNIKKLRLFLSGKKKELVVSIEREMREASKKTDFERAEKLRRQLFALQHIRDTALIGNEFGILNLEFGNSAALVRRIEGYDISNISGTYAVGSMVVFSGSKPDKNEYRKFKIRTIRQSDDVGMIREILLRRFSRNLPSAGGREAWPLPDLVLVDGGRGQVNAAEAVLNEFGMKIPVVGIAKGSERKKNEFIGKTPKWTDEKVLIRVRDEAHRFAIKYHRKLRSALLQ